MKRILAVSMLAAGALVPNSLPADTATVVLSTDTLPSTDADYFVGYFDAPDTPQPSDDLVPMPAPPVFYQDRVNHDLYLILESGAWVPLTLSLVELGGSECWWSQWSEGTDENGNAINWVWYGHRTRACQVEFGGTVDVPPGGFPDDLRYWIYDSTTGEWSDAFWAVEGFYHFGVTFPGSGFPDLPVKVVPSELRVLNNSRFRGDMHVVGKVRVPPGGGLSMGEFTQGPRP